MISSSANTATWGVVTAAAGAPPGTAANKAGTACTSGTSTLAGASYTVPANLVGTGTTFYGKLLGTTAAGGASAQGIAVVTWGSSTLVTINNGGVGEGVDVDVILYWQSNSAVSVGMGWGTQAAGSVVTGLTTTSNEALAMSQCIGSGGTATIYSSFINQVH